MTVNELRILLSSLPEGYDDYDVQLVTDKRLFSQSIADKNVEVASAPLNRISSPDENSVRHRRVWLYANDRA